MSDVWTRPAGLRFPVQYHKFVSRDKDTDKLVEYRVEDIPESRYDEACRFMVEYFMPYEPKIVARRGQDDPAVREDYFNMFRHAISQKVSVACFVRGREELVGVNILEVLGRDDPAYSYEMKSHFGKCNSEAVSHILEQADIFNRHNVEHYLSGTGLAINPAYRERGVATEMIRARISVLRHLGLELTSTGYSSIGAQKAAAKAGSLVDFRMSYAGLAKINPEWNFCGTSSTDYVQMSSLAPRRKII